MDLRFKYGNFLFVDGVFLQAGDPKRLYEVLTEAKELISLRLPKPAARVAVMRLQGGQTRVHRRVIVKSLIFNPDGTFNKDSSSGIFSRRENLQPRFRIYWDMAVDAGYTPEVRMTSGSDKELDGALLFVSITSLQ